MERKDKKLNKNNELRGELVVMNKHIVYTIEKLDEILYDIRKEQIFENDIIDPYEYYDLKCAEVMHNGKKEQLGCELYLFRHW